MKFKPGDTIVHRYKGVTINGTVTKLSDNYLWIVAENGSKLRLHKKHVSLIKEVLHGESHEQLREGD